MDAKRELASVDLSALVVELGPRCGAIVDKAYRYGDDLLRLRLRDPDQGRLELVIEVGTIKRAHLADPSRVPDAPERPPNFAKMLRNRLAGARLTAVEQHEFDRILRFRFERADETTTVVVELFGDGNVAVLDATGRVVDCLETVRLTSRTVVPGSQYEYPASRVDPFDISFETFAGLMGESDTDVVRTLATQLNLGGLYAEELCTRAGVAKTLAIEAATGSDFEAVFEEIEALGADLEAGRFDPRVYRENGEPVDVAPVVLEEYAALEAEPAETVNEAVDRYFDELNEGTWGATTDTDLAERLERQRRIIDQQEQAIESFAEEAAAQRATAERLYAAYELVDEVLTTVREAREAGHGWDEIRERLAAGADRDIEAAEAVEDVHPEDGTVTLDLGDRTVTLEPSMGVEKNANRLYEEAKAIEEKREGAIEALAESKETLEKLLRREAGPEESPEAGPTDVDWLSRASIPVKRPERWYERFRWFHTTDGFLVIGGRSADQNEELVAKYLEGGDRFLHTDAHGAPATILKATGPNEASRDVDFPEPTVEQAAQFAVTYSSLWREGLLAGDVYLVRPEQVSKTPESGEYLEKGAFAIRGERTYFHDVEVGAAVGIQCEPETRVVGGPPAAVEAVAETVIAVEPGRYNQADVAKRLYRRFRERFADTAFVRQIASPDEIGRFLPPGGSRIVDDA